MMLYVLDITGQQPDAVLEDEDAFRAELVWLNKELFRSCTTNLYTMKLYYNSLVELIGKYVTMEVYEYHVDSSYDERDEEPPSDIVSTIAMTKYNSEAPDGRTINSLSVLISYQLGDSDDLFVVPDAINDLYTDTQLACTMPEIDDLNIIALLFTKLGEYVPALSNDEDIAVLKHTLFEIIPVLVYDFYDTSARFSMCPVRLEMIWFQSLSFIM